MPRNRAAIAAALSSKGFEERQGSRDHDFYFFVHSGLVRAVFTKLSRGRQYRTIDDSLLGRMSKQLQLTKRQFEDLVDCPMDRATYVEELRSRGVLS